MMRALTVAGDRVDRRDTVSFPRRPRPLRGHRKGHGHDHDHQHDHHHHDHEHDHDRQRHEKVKSVVAGELLVLRPASGLSGDMLLAGLARMSGVGQAELDTIALSLGLPEGCVRIERRAVSDVYGWGCRIALPEEHSHRTLADIRTIITASALTEAAKGLAVKAFELLAMAEGRVHGIAPDAVTFHEVGALDSILDTCLCAALFDRIAPARFICGPLPLCDGTVMCAHGPLAVPAPAVLELLEGVPVRGIDSVGETVTPTAISMLKAFGARFGPWPAMTIRDRALVYGGRVLPGVANGAIFAIGAPAERDAP